MLLYNKGVYRDVDDERIKIGESQFDESFLNGPRSAIFIDGLKYMDAMLVYIEHKQYKIFRDSVGVNVIAEMFGSDECLLFVDIGSRDQGTHGFEEFKDYTAKAKEGINYFEDVITPEDKNCEYKENYIEAEVRL